MSKLTETWINLINLFWHVCLSNLVMIILEYQLNIRHKKRVYRKLDVDKLWIITVSTLDKKASVSSFQMVYVYYILYSLKIKSGLQLLSMPNSKKNEVKYYA